MSPGGGALYRKGAIYGAEIRAGMDAAGPETRVLDRSFRT